MDKYLEQFVNVIDSEEGIDVKNSVTVCFMNRAISFFEFHLLQALTWMVYNDTWYTWPWVLSQDILGHKFALMVILEDMEQTASAILNGWQ